MSTSLKSRLCVVCSSSVSGSESDERDSALTWTRSVLGCSVATLPGPGGWLSDADVLSSSEGLEDRLSARRYFRFRIRAACLASFGSIMASDVETLAANRRA